MERARPQYAVQVETDVPMQTRDGVRLNADVYRPDVPGRFPVLLSRTPYGKEAASTAPNGSSQFFARYGYVTVMQDCRGRFASERDYEPIFQEVADGYDAVEWAARLPWANGRVGATGQSYLGLTQYAMACNDPLPPSLQAMAPISASSDHHASWVYHSGGAAMWGGMVPYAILKGRNTLERVGRSDLLPTRDAYGEPGTNFGQPLTDTASRHLPIQDWGERLREAAPYFAEHVRQADDGEARVQRDVAAQEPIHGYPAARAPAPADRANRAERRLWLRAQPGHRDDDPHRAPARILARHPPNQGLGLPIDARPTRSAPSALPRPMPAPRGAMPAHHRVAVDKEEGSPPPLPGPGEGGPEPTISLGHPDAPVGPAVDLQLMPQGQVLQDDVVSGPDQHPQPDEPQAEEEPHEPTLPRGGSRTHACAQGSAHRLTRDRSQF